MNVETRNKELKGGNDSYMIQNRNKMHVEFLIIIYTIYYIPYH